MRSFLISWGALALAAVAAIAPGARADVILAGYAESSVRRYTEAGPELPPLVAPGSGGVVGPSGIAFGPDGFLYVTNQTSVFSPGAPDSIVKVNPVTGAVTPFISLASGYVPAGIAFGPDGFLYVSRNGGQTAAAGSGRVDRYNATTGAFVNTAVTNLTQPTALLFTGNNLFVSDFGDGTVVKYDGTTQSVFIAAGSGGLASPSGMRIGPDGKLYVVDLLLGAVRRYSATTGAFDADFIAAGGSSPLANQFPSDLQFDRLGHLLVADLGSSFNPADPASSHGNIKEFDANTGAFITNFASNILGASQLALTPVPEPGSLVLCGFAAVGGAAAVRRRRAAKG